jgi:UDP-N-acetylglucosamine--N-acetylmuramyl-(pentapeptide) pyrophosphoryl-undecaprenol N-acetylglucosamine transferase
MATIKPDLVLGMGGFISGPSGMAARFLKIPLIIHEQNAIPGLTNKFLASFKPFPLFTSRFTQKIIVLEAFPDSFPKEVQAILTGNPVREELIQFEPPEKRWQNQSGRLKLLILGGSLGAQAINQIVPGAIALMPAHERPEIYHQAGEKHLEFTQALYESYQIDGNIVSFIDDIAKAYLWADLVICRAGATTLAELCSVGIGSILVPFPYAVDDHQTKNANHLSKACAAILIPQAHLTTEELTKQ